MKKDKIPHHIGIIMDGNGRWAKRRLMPRVAGHRKGAQVIRKIAYHASQLGIKVLTLYAFSTENWGRPREEVEYLMNLPKEFFDEFLPQAVENNIKIEVMGNIAGLPEKTHGVIKHAMESTAHCTGLSLNFALNYGGRQEILQVTKELIKEVLAGNMEIDNIDVDLMSHYFETSRYGLYQDPDLIIRTSGELRLSNFLLWEAAYSEFYFADIYWPDFDENALDEAISNFQNRKRRFGKLDEPS